MGTLISEKGNRIARYLVAFTGSPLWRFRYGHGAPRGFDSPPGLDVRLVTGKKVEYAVKLARELRDEKDSVAVIYYSHFPEPENAVAIVPLRHYAELLSKRLTT